MQRLLVTLVLMSALSSWTAHAETVVYISMAAENRIGVYSLDEDNGALRNLGDT